MRRGLCVALGWIPLYPYWNRKRRLKLGLADEALELSRAGLDFISFPIPDRKIPAAGEAAKLVGKLARALDSGKNVVVHCRQSVGRSGLIASAVLVASGLDPERAIALVSQARGQAVPETPEQLAWVLQLPAAAALRL